MSVARLFIVYVHLLCIGISVANVSSGKPRGVFYEYYLDDICFSNRRGEFYLEENGPQAALKIKSSISKPLFRRQHCRLTVEPPPFHGLVLVFRNGFSEELAPHHCKNYIEIFSGDQLSQKFCNFSSDIGVERIFTTTQRMEILVNIENSSRHDHVSMLFTAYDKRLYTCTPDNFQCDNSLCLWKGFVCDGENNCGDYSDERKSGNLNCVS